MGTPIAGFNGSVVITSTPNVALTNEVLTDAGDHKTFNISSGSFATKRYWDRTAAFVVQTAPDGVTWSTASPSTYTIRYVTGQVFFASAVTGGTPSCRISSGAYLPFSTFANMKQWEATPALDLYDSTTFGSQWKTYTPGMLGADVKLTQFYSDLTFSNQITANTAFVVSCMTGRNATERFEGFAYLKGDDIKVAVNALEEESLTYTVTGQLYYFAGQYV
jgi:hypothetical protein